MCNGGVLTPAARPFPSSLWLKPITRARIIAQSPRSLGGPRGSGTLSIISNIFHTEGIAGLFRGLGPELSQGVLSAAVMMMVKEKVQALFVGASKQVEPTTTTTPEETEIKLTRDSPMRRSDAGNVL